MPQENINSLEQAKWSLIPDDIKENRKDFNADNIREELYKRSAKITQELVYAAENYPQKNLKLELDEIANTQGLSKKQKEIFEEVVNIIEEHKQKVNELLSLVDSELENFLQVNNTELQKIGVNKETEKSQLLGTILFYAQTGKIPKDKVELIENPLLIEIQISNEEDMKTLQKRKQASLGFYSRNRTYKLGASLVRVPTLVKPADATWTGLHEKNHNTYAIFRKARNNIQQIKRDDIDEMIKQFHISTTKEEPGIPGAAIRNMELQGNLLAKIRHFILEEAKDEMLTRHRTGDLFKAFGEDKDLLEHYILITFKYKNLLNSLENNDEMQKYLNTFKELIIEDIRATTKYTYELLTGIKLLQHEDREQALLSLLETKDLEDWGDEINKVYKGDQQIYVRLGQIFSKLDTIDRDNPLWEEFKNIQKAFIFGVNEMQIPIKVVAAQLEDKIKGLEDKA